MNMKERDRQKFLERQAQQQADRGHRRAVARGQEALYRAAKRAYETERDIVGEFTLD